MGKSYYKVENNEKLIDVFYNTTDEVYFIDLTTNKKIIKVTLIDKIPDRELLKLSKAIKEEKLIHYIWTYDTIGKDFRITFQKEFVDDVDNQNVVYIDALVSSIGVNIEIEEE